MCAVGPPLSGSTTQCAQFAQGNVGSYAWSFWSNSGECCMTTYDNAECAFSASWGNSADFLARCGLEWDATKTHDQLGTISAEFAETHSGSASSFSYIGVYGWTQSPCVEYYIVEDSFDAMPVHLGSVINKGTVEIDGGTYVLYTHNMTGTGGTRCPGDSSWMQYYSVRTTARSCGRISVSQHFDAWATAGMPLGKMYEVSLLVETGGGPGSVDLTTGVVAVTSSAP